MNLDEFLFSKPERPYRSSSALGAIVIGITMPSLLVIWHTRFFLHGNVGQIAGSISGRVIFCATIEIAAIFFCGPGAVILGSILFSNLRWRALGDKTIGKPKKLMTLGMILGSFMAFLNFPGYAVIALVNPAAPFELLRIALLFIVAGATSGLWIGWQAYRSTDVEAKFFPQVSLGVLMTMVIAWGALMAIFRP